MIQPRLCMMMKAPVVFPQFDPSLVESQDEWDCAVRGSSSMDEAAQRSWLRYAKALIALAEPCMEANGGVSATVRLAAGCRGLSSMKISWCGKRTCLMEQGVARLYLRETAEGNVFLYFFAPWMCSWLEEKELRIDLSDYGSADSARFIAALFAARESVVAFSMGKN